MVLEFSIVHSKHCPLCRECSIMQPHCSRVLHYAQLNNTLSKYICHQNSCHIICTAILLTCITTQNAKGLRFDAVHSSARSLRMRWIETTTSSPSIARPAISLSAIIPDSPLNQLRWKAVACALSIYSPYLPVLYMALHKNYYNSYKGKIFLVKMLTSQNLLARVALVAHVILSLTSQFWYLTFSGLAMHVVETHCQEKSKMSSVAYFVWKEFTLPNTTRQIHMKVKGVEQCSRMIPCGRLWWQ